MPWATIATILVNVLTRAPEIVDDIEKLWAEIHPSAPQGGHNQDSAEADQKVRAAITRARQQGGTTTAQHG